MLKTAESVKRGHPDKICDQISDAILDECLKQDENSRVAIEVMGGHNNIYVCGELTTKAYVNIHEIAKKVYKDVGYKDNIGVITNIVSQSSDISQGVDIGGAGDQGIMVGYGCNDNKAMIPTELYLAREITLMLEGLQDEKILPDGKAQVTLNSDNKILKMVISNQTTDEDYLKDAIRRRIFADESIKAHLAPETEIYINPTGKFEIGGFEADTGLTGRKLVVDNYGPQVSLGGGCFSGKDPSKVDRSGAYMARKIAVDCLKKYEAEEALVKLAYVIGKADPAMAIAIVKTKTGEKFINLLTDGEAKYDLSPKGIINFLELKNPIYYKTAQHGHFGHNFKWDIAN